VARVPRLVAPLSHTRPPRARHDAGRAFCYTARVPLVPGPLGVFHRVFIALAIVAVALYAVLELRHWSTGDAGGVALLRAAIGFAAALGLAGYLRRVRGGRDRIDRPR
jgi:hypothetical protein